jgi:hypothetical protein
MRLQCDQNRFRRCNTTAVMLDGDIRDQNHDATPVGTYLQAKQSFKLIFAFSSGLPVPLIWA